ncbi:MAG TPA: transglutaminase domain-containing protein [Planctomycetota bacterium]|nr:transglutaminase domain-containing protein [Planctomycetota bacterium]
MTGKTAWGASFAAVAALVGATLALGGARADDGKQPTAGTDAYTIPLHKRHFEFTYEVDVTRPEGAKRLDLWIPVPTSDEHQVCKVEKISAAGVGYTGEDPAPDAHGNTFQHFRFEGDPSGARITMRVDVLRHEYLRKDFRGRGNEALSDAERAKLADFLKADRLVPIDGKIGALSKELAGDEKNVVNLARKFYDHVLETMKYDKPAGQPWGRGDAVWACDSKYGNCSDFHSVFIGLCRAQGIPARFSIGFPIPDKRGEGEVGGYHCWAEFYVAGYGWVPVDISEARKHPELAEYYFGAHTEDRVQFSTGRDLTLVPPQKGEPVNFIVYPYAEVDGKPWDGVKRKFAYKDLP